MRTKSVCPSEQHGASTSKPSRSRIAPRLCHRDPGRREKAPPHRKLAAHGGPRQVCSTCQAVGTGFGLMRLVFYHARLASHPSPLEVSESPPHSVNRDSIRATAVFRAVSYDRPLHSDRELASSSQTGDAQLVSTLCEPRAVALRNSTALPLASPPAQESLPGCAIERSGGTNHTFCNLPQR